MPFSTYIRGVRFDRPVKGLAKLTTSPTFDANELVGAEVRVTDSRGVERLYAVLAQDPKTGVLHLKDIEGHATIISH